MTKNFQTYITLKAHGVGKKKFGSFFSDSLKEMDSQIHTSSPKLVNQIYLYVVTKF